MCGIGGVISTNQSYIQQRLDWMSDKMISRGPDNKGVVIHENFGFVHRRLSIIDLSDNSNQPIESESYILVFNGEIYNYIEIINEEGLPDNLKLSDTKFLFYYLEKFGVERTLRKIKGMFAFSWFDVLTKDLILARDHFGKKPLYYSKNKDSFQFCSDIKGIDLVEKKINQIALDHYLYEGAMPQPFTIWKEISQVPPGTYLKFESKTQEVKSSRYFDLDKSESLYDNEEEVIKQSDFLIDQAVARRMISDVPVGAFLSGGVDSSLVAYYMAKNSESKINTYTIGFKGDQNNELDVAKVIANELGTHHNEFNIDFNPSDLIEELVDYIGEPLADPSILPTFLICKEISQKVTVALSGDGGDEVFYGYPTFRVAKEAEEVNKKFLKYYLNKLSSKLGRKSADNYAYLCDFKNLSPAKMINRFIGFDDQSRELLTGNASSNSFYNNYYSLDYASSLPSNLSKLFLQGRLLNSYLVKVDRMSMKNSLEVRSPLLDVDVVSYIQNVSDNIKLKENKSKYITKKLLSNVLPEEILNLPKKGFGVPVDDLFRNELTEITSNYFNEYKGSIINKDFILDLFNEHRTFKGNNGTQLWNILILLIWMKQNNINDQ
jgi:asparagine synthase (glutamine-hydrolysing)